MAYTFAANVGERSPPVGAEAGAASSRPLAIVWIVKTARVATAPAAHRFRLTRCLRRFDRTGK
jgi:hypothetical protein